MTALTLTFNFLSLFYVYRLKKLTGINSIYILLTPICLIIVNIIIICIKHSSIPLTTPYNFLIYTIHPCIGLTLFVALIIIYNKINQIKKLYRTKDFKHSINNHFMPIINLAKMVLTELPKDSTAYKRQECVIKAAREAKELVKKIPSFK